MPTSAVSGPAGLSDAEVDERRHDGRVNRVERHGSRSLSAIVRSNVFTLFNLVLTVAVTLVLITGRWPDAVFGLVMVVNSAIGVITEVRAKRTLDRLSILDAPHARVRRAGVERTIDLPDIVVDDVLLVGPGDQVPADGVVLEVAGLELDESMLTGESRPVRKAVDDELLSGSSVVAGSALCRVTRVGADAYANRLAVEARKFSVVRSELRDGVNAILRVVSAVIVPVAFVLAWSQVRDSGGWAAALADGSWRDAVVAAVAGVVGMIPEGLVLLTSLNFALAAILLARQGVLVQELPAVETLARVDVLCLDKTGTLTDGTVALASLDVLTEITGARAALAAFAADADGNATAGALAAGVVGVDPARVTGRVPFSSARKWSALVAADGGWVLGAPEVLLAGRDDDVAVRVLADVRERAGSGARVVLLAHAVRGLVDPDAPLPSDLVPALVATLGEHIRPDAAATLAYFRDQGVRAMVISGDNPDTVAAIATTVGLAGPGTVLRGVDARGLPSELPALAEIAARDAVYGRVAPEQKRALVHALQSRGHVVAMTGDGGNDALARKDADLGIAMGSGSSATKAVARIVLVDSEFSTLPGVVAQGRRVMANMERVAGLFLAKTTWASVIAVAVVLLAWPYPFLPRHLTIAGSLTIGIPAFFLALPPNNRRYLPGFLRRVLAIAVPAGVTIAIAVLVSFGRLQAVLPLAAARSAATLELIGLGLVVVALQSRPWNAWRVGLVVTMAAAAALVVAVPFAREFFALEVPDARTLATMGITVVIGGVTIVLVEHVLARRRPGAGSVGSVEAGDQANGQLS